MSNKKNAQLYQVAELYYIDNLPQREIASQLGCSVSSVSRLLIEARESGIVEVRIQRDIENHPHLANALKTRFHLKEVIVVKSSGRLDKDAERVARMGAQFIQDNLRDKMVLGMNWGQLITTLVESFTPPPVQQTKVVQMTGSLGRGDPLIDGPRPAFLLSEMMQSEFHMIPAPAIVDAPDIRDRLIHQPQVAMELELAGQIDMAVMEVGGFGAGVSSLERGGYLTHQDVVDLVAQGAVAHVLGTLIDAGGNEIGHLSDRIIGLKPEQLRHAEHAILLGAGTEMAPAIAATIAGQFFNTIIVDETVATALLSL